MRPRRTSHMQALRQHDTASAWLLNEFTLYISEGAREREVQKKRVISNSVVETQSGAFHTWLICPNLTSPSC